MTQQIRVSKSGINALTATDPNDFIFHSDYNTFKIIAEGTVSPSLESTGSEEPYNILHGQSFVPFVFGFCKFSNGRVAPPGTKDSANDFWFTKLYVEDDTISFYHYNNTGGNYTPTFKYIICESPIA